MRRGVFRILIATGGLAVLGAHLGGGPAHARMALQKSLDEVDAAILTTSEVQQSGQSGSQIGPFDNPGLPDGCNAVSASQIICHRSYAINSWPYSGSYPYWLRVQVFESAATARREVESLRFYRPLQEGVIAKTRDEPSAMSLSYEHSWGDHTSWAMRGDGRYVVEATCSAARLAPDFGRLQSCAEGVVSAQLSRLQAILGGGLLLPGSPQGVSSTWDGEEVSLTWLPPIDDGGSPITVFEVLDESGAIVCSTSATGATIGQCSISRIDDGTQPVYSVHAVNGVGRGEGSTPVEPTLVVREIPAVKRVRARVTNGRVQVTWKKVKLSSSSGAVTYRVVSSPGSSTCKTKKQRCTIKDLDQGKDYVFTVVAVYRGIQSPGSMSNVVTIPNPASSANRPGPSVIPRPEVKPEQAFS